MESGEVSCFPRRTGRGILGPVLLWVPDRDPCESTVLRNSCFRFIFQIYMYNVSIFSLFLGYISKSRCLQLYVTKNVNSFVLNQKDIYFSSTKFRGDILSHVSEVCRTQVCSSDKPVSFIII